MDEASAQDLRAIISESPLLMSILNNWDRLELTDVWLVAGAIAQTVWNHAFGLPSHHGLSDIDIVYFEPDDLSEGAEGENAARIRQIFSHLPVWIDVKNEARVHQWYEDKFGYPLEPYASSAHAITTFPTTATAIGVRPVGDSLEIQAPFGLSDLLGLVVRPNKTQIRRDTYDQKVSRWIKLWPGLKVVDWDQ